MKAQKNEKIVSTLFSIETKLRFIMQPKEKGN